MELFGKKNKDEKIEDSNVSNENIVNEHQKNDEPGEHDDPGADGEEGIPGSDDNVTLVNTDEACCCNCKGTDENEAWIYCNHLKELEEIEGHDETGETTGCNFFTEKDEPNQPKESKKISKTEMLYNAKTVLSNKINKLPVHKQLKESMKRDLNKIIELSK